MLKKISFRWKLYITYSVIISFILAVSLYGFYQYNAGLLERNMEESSLDMLEVSKERLTDFLSDMDQQLRFFHTLPEFVTSAEMLQSKDRTENYFINHPGEAFKIQEMFLSILVTEPDDSSISYVSKNYNNIHASVSGGYEKTILNQELRDEIGLKELNSSEEPFSYIFPHKDYWSTKDEYVISVYRPMRDMFQEYGVLIYDKNIEELGAVLKQNSDEVILLNHRTKKCTLPRPGSVKLMKRYCGY